MWGSRSWQQASYAYQRAVRPHPSRHCSDHGRAARHHGMWLDEGTARSSDPSGPPKAAPQLPPTTGNFDYQLGEAYAPATGVTVVTRDSTSKPAKGVYSICYVNGFQTQPGSQWPTSLILKTESGAPLVDPGWPDEHIIDISTSAKRKTAAARIAKSTDLCASKGFAAVEFDNLDSYSRSEGALTLSQAVVFATLLVNHAHSRGLRAARRTPASSTSGARRRSALTSRRPRSATPTTSAGCSPRFTARMCSTSSTATTSVARSPRCVRGR